MKAMPMIYDRTKIRSRNCEFFNDIKKAYVGPEHGNPQSENLLLSQASLAGKI
jgi:hypothetical protein